MVTALFPGVLGMKTFSICLAVFFLLCTIDCVYRVYLLPSFFISPLIPKSIIPDMQRPFIIMAVINFAFFLPALFVAIKRKRLATPGIVCTIAATYVITIIVLRYTGFGAYECEL